MYDNYMAVGVPNSDSLGRITGIVYMYERINSSWKKIASLAPSDPGNALQFGISVRMSADYLLVSAAGYGGKVYLFKKQASGWSSQTELTTFNSQSGYRYSRFGAGDLNPVDISADQQTIVIADQSHPVTQTPFSEGAIFVYHKQPAQEWNNSIVPVRIVGPDQSNASFGSGGVALYNNRLATATRYASTGNGAIYVYRDAVGDFSTSVLEARLTISPNDSYGIGLGYLLFTSDGIFTTAPVDIQTNPRSAILYYATPSSGSWSDASPTCYMKLDPIKTGNSFRQGLSTNGSDIYVAFHDSQDNGYFNVLRKGTGSWCKPEYESIDVHAPAPGHLYSAYGNINAVNQTSNAVVGYVGLPSDPNAQLALNTFTRNPDQSWTSQLVFSSKKSTEGHRYGRAILGFEDFLFVGSPLDGTVRNGGGVVYSYEKSGGSWQPTGKILTPPGGRYDDAFGTALATNGRQIAIGAAGYEPHGRVFIYQKTNSNWNNPQIVQEITLPENILTVAAYGDNLAMTDQWLVIPYVQNSPFRMMIAIYRYNGATWDYFQAVEATGGSFFQKQSTIQVAIEGETIVAGGLIIERNASGMWQGKYQLLPSDPEPLQISPDFTHWITDGSLFGQSVAINDNTIFIGAPGKDFGNIWNVGAVYVYTKEPGEPWSSRTETTKLLPRLKDENQLFGWSLKALHNTLISGAPGADFNKDGTTARNQPGRSYVFQSIDYYWTDVIPYYDFTGDSFVKDYYGLVVNLDESDFIVSAPIEDILSGKLSGSVYITPTPPLLVLKAPVCLTGGVVDLLGYPFGGTWSGPGIIDRAEGIFDPLIAGVGTHEFTYLTASCTFPGRLRIQIIAPPEIVLITDSKQRVCSESITINVAIGVQPQPSSRYLWYYRQNSTVPFTPIGILSASMTATNRGEYQVRVSNRACVLFSPVVTIENEIVEISITPIPLICGPTPNGILLTADFPGGQWSGSGVTGNRFFPDNLSDGLYNITYNVLSVKGCRFLSITRATIFRLSPPVIQRLNGDLCINGVVNLAVEGAIPVDVAYSWYKKEIQGGSYNLVGTATALTASAPGYYQVVARRLTCSQSSSVVLIEAIMKAAMKPDQQEVILCHGDKQTLTMQKEATFSYKWYRSDNMNRTNPLLLNSEDHFIDTDKSGYYYSIVKSGICSFEGPLKHVIILPADSIFVPNVFTPNGDTFNEVFKVGPPRGGLSLVIMNRDGQELFSDNTNNGWTGDGHESGVYFWSVHYTGCRGESRYAKGTVTLQR